MDLGFEDAKCFPAERQSDRAAARQRGRAAERQRRLQFDKSSSAAR
ncbi:hypothetical protein EYF80_067682 [Liparis tanakae]|uniref:Uncharacterized protein n=1 Tax=Liparis tanakae TaxID=230148 RepID=A0A4Z2E0A9_9TELE|nr:hypothetical protein EYF80_067682 [Liparis tanakae]